MRTIDRKSFLAAGLGACFAGVVAVSAWAGRPALSMAWLALGALTGALHDRRNESTLRMPLLAVCITCALFALGALFVARVP